MNTAVISTKIDLKTKREAQKTAASLGMPLSVIIKALLKQFIRTKSLEVSARDEEPSEYLKNAIRQAEKDWKAGKVSPAFDNPEDAIAWLNDPKARYKNENRVQP